MLASEPRAVTCHWHLRGSACTGCPLPLPPVTGNWQVGAASGHVATQGVSIPPRVARPAPGLCTQAGDSQKAVWRTAGRRLTGRAPTRTHHLHLRPSAETQPRPRRLDGGVQLRAPDACDNTQGPQFKSPTCPSGPE